VRTNVVQKRRGSMLWEKETLASSDRVEPVGRGRLKEGKKKTGGAQWLPV